MSFDVRFHYGPLVTHPLNLGSMPLLTLETDAVAGLMSHSTMVLQQGQPPVNFSFPEQMIVINATVEALASYRNASFVQSPHWHGCGRFRK